MTLRLRQFAIIVLCLCPSLAVAVDVSRPFWPVEHASALEVQFFQDAVDGQLDHFTLLEGALLAAGVNDAQDLSSYRERFGKFVDELIGRVPPETEIHERGRIALEFLHDRILKGSYRAECTLVTAAIDRGDYNCVSATVLYLSFCEALGIPAITVSTPSHVYARVVNQGASHDVQTTHRHGISPAGRIPSTAVRTLSAIELLAKVYYNRSVVLLDQQRYADALPLLHGSEQLDPADENTRENIQAAVNNWALLEVDRGEYSRAAQLIKTGIQINPTYEPFLANDLHIHQKWVLSLRQQQRFEEAISLLDARHRERPDVELFHRGRFSLYRLWGQDLLAAGRVAEARKVFAEMGDRFPEFAESVALEINSFADAAQDALEHGDRTQAKEVLDAGLSLQPQDQRLLQLRNRLTLAIP